MDKRKCISISLCILLVIAIIVINHFFEQYRAYSVILFILLALVAVLNKGKGNKV